MSTTRRETRPIGPSWTDVPELRDFAHAAEQVGKMARDFAAAMSVSTSEAMLMLTKAMEALAPRNLITIHPDTIRRMHAAALHRREDRP